MPRKRATRAQTERAKPKLSEAGDDVKGMSVVERQEKLAHFLQDFDITMENYRKMYAEHLIEVERLIDERYRKIRMQLSKREKQLTVKEYDEEQNKKEEDEKENEMVQQPSVLSSIQQTLSKYQMRKVIEPIPEEEGEDSVSTVKKAKRVKGANKSVAFNPTPASSSRYVTPAMQRSMQVMEWGATPAVTPKFNPRLPITPGLKRQPKPGEILMSLSGSPIEVGSKLQRKQGKTLEIQIPEGQEYNEMLENLNIPDVIDTSDMTGANIKKMMSVFASIMNNGGSS